ncbi:hypothetical protein TNCV_537351 [Trichonephila clavipes]|nr:hypothetical protein TNCV_537351 [Trichonephila clavipes]
MPTFAFWAVESCFSSYLLFLTVSLRAASVAAVAEWSRYRIMAGVVTSSSPVPLKTHRVRKRCTLNLSIAQESSTSLLHGSKLSGQSPKALT